VPSAGRGERDRYPVGGAQVLARLASTADFGELIRFTTEYSLFGAFWLAWTLATISQIALNDGNYYESINGGQNLIGGWKRWKRTYLPRCGSTRSARRLVGQLPRAERLLLRRQLPRHHRAVRDRNHDR
jgi:hypothetical protein